MVCPRASCPVLHYSLTPRWAMPNLPIPNSRSRNSRSQCSQPQDLPPRRWKLRCCPGSLASQVKARKARRSACCPSDSYLSDSLQRAESCCPPSPPDWLGSLPAYSVAEEGRWVAALSSPLAVLLE